jgi:type I restriction enzyme S subunit
VNKKWETKKLSELCKISTGKWDANHSTEDGKYRFYTCAYNYSQCNTKRFSGECLILPGNGVNVGEVFYYQGDFDAYQRTYVISNIQICAKFLYFHLMCFWKDRNLNKQHGSATNFLKIGNFNNYLVTYPPLIEQERIVALLDKSLAVINKAKENTEKNLKKTNELIESYLHAVFTPAPGVDWRMEKLEALTNLTRGHNPPKSKFSREHKSGYIRFYQIRDGASDDYAVYVPDTPQLHKMNKEDIMMVAYRHVGRVFRGVEGAFNVALCKISNTHKHLLDNEYLFEIIPSRFIKGELLKKSERSLIPSMSIEHLKKLKIPLPSLIEQQSIVKNVNCLRVQAQSLECLYRRKIKTLEELQKSIFQMAFNGKLTEVANQTQMRLEAVA